jgi:hypothetical protein
MMAKGKRTIRQLEESVVRAAFGAVNDKGWLFDAVGRVHYAHKCQRLERAIHRLKEARKAKRRRPSTTVKK